MMSGKYSKYSPFLLIGIFISLSVLYGCDNASKSNVEVSMHSANMVEKVFEKTRTFCFGRFLLEIPEAAVIDYGPTWVETEITFHKDQAEKIPELLAAQIAESRNKEKHLPSYSMSDLPLIGKVYDGVLPGQKIFFGASDSVSYSVYSFMPVEEDLFLQEFGSLPGKDVISKVNDVASNLRLRSDSTVPDDPGICIHGGFVSMSPEFERAAIGIRFEDFPDVRISIDAHKNQDNLRLLSDPKVLRQGARREAESRGLGNFFSGIETLRDRRRQLGPWEGVEIATRRPKFKSDTDAHEFRFHSLGSKNDALHPELDIRFDSGVLGNAKAKVSPSVTNEEALEIWDRIINTIRLRQSSDATPLTLESPQVLLGKIAMSNTTCPQTGNWECTHKNKILGRRIRIIKEGDTMPYVSEVDRFYSVLKLFNTSQSKIATSWKLVGYADIE